LVVDDAELSPRPVSVAASGVTEPPASTCRLGETGSPLKWKVSTAKATLAELVPS
jgi:hypothetical protein